jgi:hypothetical protein
LAVGLRGAIEPWANSLRNRGAIRPWDCGALWPRWGEYIGPWGYGNKSIMMWKNGSLGTCVYVAISPLNRGLIGKEPLEHGDKGPGVP